MKTRRYYYAFSIVMLLMTGSLICHQHIYRKKNVPANHVQAETSFTVNKTQLLSAYSNSSGLADTLHSQFDSLSTNYYQRNQFTLAWIGKGRCYPIADSLLKFIARAKLYGLFPEDYHYRALSAARVAFNTIPKTFKNDLFCARTDLLFTDAFFLLVKDLKQGRLPYDSVSLRKDSLLQASFYYQALTIAMESKNLSVLNGLEPKYKGYLALKVGLKNFLDSVQRYPDSAAINREKFLRIAINLDRYKLLPDTLPPTYVWVNIPAFKLEVVNQETRILESKIIVGRSDKPTPLLNSDITDFVICPQWSIPPSIAQKEILPKIQHDVTYLKRKHLIVYDQNDRAVDPTTIPWHNLSPKKFPYRLRQREGDHNSLGLIKFNFQNKYSVYLHDTNAKDLFEISNRALSHGCVRVKECLRLADYLVRRDTINYNPENIRQLMRNKTTRTITGFPNTPVFIRYFSSEGINGQITFYDDVYGEDKNMIKKYFSGKKDS